MAGSNLVLHCGANVATMEQVAGVGLPEATDSFQPISHKVLYDLVRAELERTGLQIAEEAHGLYRDGQRYFGLLKLKNGDHPDYTLAAGVRNAHDQSFSAAIAIGSYVLVCDNLAFSGEVMIARKHTRFIERDLPNLVTRAVGLLTDQRGRQEERIVAYKGTEVTDLVMHDLVIHALDTRILPVTKIPAVLDEWRKPTYEEFKPRTAWSAFNAFTYVLKGTNVMELGRRTMALHGIVDGLAGVSFSQTTGAVDAEFVVDGVKVAA